MKHADFDGRLDGIMVRAAVRLHERMAFAFAHGRLADYLRRIGLAEELHLGKQHNVNLAEIEEEVLLLLAAKLRRARKMGTLRSLLRQLNMTELLQAGCCQGISQKKRSRHVLLPHQARRLSQAEAARPAAASDSSGSSGPNVIQGPFTGIK
ncbi:hypothetical protein [uncultured Mitsuokella sp.]|uniref:hypothetical protein n=1 Tax=uncultured Mitsuokella sp. TaxID=453120 RepID=UPI0025EEE1B1|nr:hypothetical protein [uncultured Mitsuokella sp.]